MEGSRIARGCGTDMCGVRLVKVLTFPFVIPTTMIQAEMFATLCVQKNVSESNCVCSGSQATLRTHETSRVMSKHMFDCR